MPFTFHMEAWRTVIGWLLICFGCSFVITDIKSEYRKEIIQELAHKQEEMQQQENINSDNLKNDE